MNELRAGIIGLTPDAIQLIRELDKNESFLLKAVAGKDRELLEDIAQQYDVRPYDDYRSLIVEEKLDTLFLMIPTHLCDPLIQLAAKKKIHLFKPHPLARTLPEAMNWIELTERASIRLHVSTPLRFAPGFLEAHQLINQGHIGQIYLVRAEWSQRFQGDFDWRGDPALSGGGSLMELGYPLIDLITWNMQTPERIFSLNANFCNKRVVPPYQTDDTSVVTMNFPDGAIANLITCWMSPTQSQKIVFEGVEGAIEVQKNAIHLYDTEANLVKHNSWNVDDHWINAQQIRHFADSLLNPEIEPITTARDHLANVATIEAAYLSAKTQCPETPKVYGTLFQV
ncbi:MAG: Gfo/Idh/MocA family oxidoreductase [Planctomycetes bacterium]|nr:Gfo/Idh/MocA family oxidoreductase [Planctomycetota bacterium]